MVLKGAAVQRGQNGVTEPLIQEKKPVNVLCTVLIQNMQLFDTDEHNFSLTFKG
jgi:hypothetical protein